jgi:cysteinyl-tRNA synthetase
MDDDFNTAAALGHLFDAVRALNRLAPSDPSAEKEKAGRFLGGYAILEPLFGVLGLLGMSAKEFFRDEPRQFIPSSEGPVSEMGSGSTVDFEPARLSAEEILHRIEARKSARAGKDFAEADRIRKELEAQGVLLEDSRAGTTWKYKT